MAAPAAPAVVVAAAVAVAAVNTQKVMPIYFHFISGGRLIPIPLFT